MMARSTTLQIKGHKLMQDHTCLTARRLWIANMSRNLLHRPPKPALGRGHVQQAAKRALLAHEGIATTGQVLEWTCAMKRHQRRPIFKADYQIARRALDRI